MKLALAGILALTFLAAGCSSSDDSSSDPTSKGGFAKELENNFLRSCDATSNGMVSYCQCMLDSAEQRFTEEEFSALDRTIIENGMNGLSAADKAWVQSTAQRCVKK